MGPQLLAVEELTCENLEEFPRTCLAFWAHVCPAQRVVQSVPQWCAVLQENEISLGEVTEGETQDQLFQAWGQ